MFELIALLVVLGVLSFVVSLQPAKFRIMRSLEMQASPGKIFERVNDFHQWQSWSPWVKLDPNAYVAFEGPTAGAGAVMSWYGNAKVGRGTSTITDSEPYSLIRIRLEFEKPFKATNIAEFKFSEENGRTLVKWSMAGTNNFIGKAVNLALNCDKMVGAQFERGLASLKEIVESQP